MDSIIPYHGNITPPPQPSNQEGTEHLSRLQVLLNKLLSILQTIRDAINKMFGIKSAQQIKANNFIESISGKYDARFYHTLQELAQQPLADLSYLQFEHAIEVASKEFIRFQEHLLPDSPLAPLKKIRTSSPEISDDLLAYDIDSMLSNTTLPPVMASYLYRLTESILILHEAKKAHVHSIAARRHIDALDNELLKLEKEIHSMLSATPPQNMSRTQLAELFKITAESVSLHQQKRKARLSKAMSKHAIIQLLVALSHLSTPAHSSSFEILNKHVHKSPIYQASVAAAPQDKELDKISADISVFKDMSQLIVIGLTGNRTQTSQINLLLSNIIPFYRHKDDPNNKLLAEDMHKAYTTACLVIKEHAMSIYNKYNKNKTEELWQHDFIHNDNMPGLQDPFWTKDDLQTLL